LPLHDKLHRQALVKAWWKQPLFRSVTHIVFTFVDTHLFYVHLLYMYYTSIIHLSYIFCTSSIQYIRLLHFFYTVYAPAGARHGVVEAAPFQVPYPRRVHAVHSSCPPACPCSHAPRAGEVESAALQVLYCHQPSTTNPSTLYTPFSTNSKT